MITSLADAGAIFITGFATGMLMATASSILTVRR